MKKKWTKAEDNLLLKLRKKSVPFKKLPEYFEGRSQDAIRNQAWILQNKKSNDWLDEEIVAAIDIESTSLKLNAGWIISYWIVRSDGKEMGACVKRREVLNGSLDKRIMKQLLKDLEGVDVVVTYYGTGFDLPALRTRCEMHGLNFPGFGSLKHFDLYYLIRNKFSLTRKSLGVACRTLGIGEKGFEPPEVWERAKIGHQESLDRLFEYNKLDTRLTMELFNRTKKYRKVTRKSI